MKAGSHEPATHRAEVELVLGPVGSWNLSVKCTSGMVFQMRPHCCVGGLPRSPRAPAGQFGTGHGARLSRRRAGERSQAGGPPSMAIGARSLPMGVPGAGPG